MKILHIFNCKGAGFYEKLISSIRENDCFQNDEHFFLLRKKESFDSIIDKTNVVLDLDKGSLVEKYSNDFDFFILHSLDSLDEPHQIPKKIRKRVVWRTWGHDAGFHFLISKNIRLMIKNNKRFYRQKREINQFAAIAIGNAIDQFDMIERYGKRAKLFRLPYITKNGIDLRNKGNNLSNNKIKILVGHSGYPGDKHIKCLNLLKPIKDKIEIYIPLSYGDKEYIGKVIEYVKNEFGDSVHILNERIEYSEYCKLLSTMNFAFFPFGGSSALGNISIALNYSVNLIVNGEGLLARVFKKEKIPFIDINTFNPEKDLIFKIFDTSSTSFRARDYNEKVNDLKLLFDYLRRKYEKKEFFKKKINELMKRDLVPLRSFNDKNKQFEVTVNCSTYNHEKYIRKCLDGILNQLVDFNVLIIVHDDASTDNTASILKEYKNKYPDNILLLLEEENQYSKSKSIIAKKYAENVKGKYVATCEGDDYWSDPYKLVTQYYLMEENEDCNLCVHKVKVFDFKNNNSYYYPKFNLGSQKLGKKKFLKIVNNSYSFQTSSYFRKTSEFKKYVLNKPEFASIMPNGDEALLLYFGQSGNVLYIDKEMSVYNKFTESSWTASSLKYDTATKIERGKRFSQSLLLFDEYTSFKYHNIVMSHYYGLLYSISKLEKNTRQLFKDKKFRHYLLLHRFWLYCYCVYKYFLRK